MINLTKEEIKQMELIGRGTYGKVYKNKDKVYKLYRPMVPKEDGTLVKNPSLKYKASRLNRLIRINQKLQYSDLIEDTIFINGKFRGVIMPYYEGKLLSKQEDTDIYQKILRMYNLLISTKELTKHYIYPTDLKLNNIIVQDGNIRIIDLDDYHTKVGFCPSSAHLKKAITSLDWTIKKYLHDYRNFILDEKIESHLQRKIPDVCKTYQGVEDYLYSKSIKHNYIFIDDTSRIENKLRLLRDPKYRIIYVCKHEDIYEAIDKLETKNITLYDLVPSYELETYEKHLSSNKCLGIKQDKMLKFKK